ncbi:Stk1 family PASTA domain-containing Ser/Thr kinase [Actinomadura scrupuli]|uniref:Stk1 family PASTA domain-containing Ser/Thr kinase n=1 Tax=Actinomadura scrupuli TaxID=559629 RepID=UPI003D968DCE
MTQPRLLGGRYELDGVIGRGGMAEVYRARDQRLDRIVAIKTLRSDLARDPTFQARFRREAQSAASLNHPSVVAVYDTGEDTMGDTLIPYIVMEFVEGSTLRDLLRENRRLLPERALEIVDGILRALDYSHRGGIIHRDIKPANVMLTRGHEVKVMDFGIARAMADSAATMTQTAQVIGTAQYLSPEQARGERVDARSDLYSTGCVLYELLTGRPPFTGDSPVAIAYQHVREEPIPPSQVDHDIPQWCDAIVLKAMAKDPGARYQSATEFRADLQRAMQGMPVAASAASTMMMGRTSVMPPAAAGPPTRAQRPMDTGYGLPPVRYDQDDDDRGGGSGKKAALWVGLAILFIGGAALIGVLLTGGSGSGNGTPSASSSASAAAIQVPQLVGLKEDAAKKAITDAGLEVGDVSEENSDSVPKGSVISSDPGEGEDIAKGEKVDLVISKGKAVKKVDVPDVTGQPYSAAQQQLQSAKFRVVRKTQSSETVPKDTVIRTDPSAGTSVSEGSKITVVVSSGTSNVTVPELRGSSPRAACNQIKSMGLRCNVQETPPDGQTPPGLVYRSDPPAGATLSAGDTVTVFVGKAQNPFPSNTPGIP